jgi:hypothetical protein
LAVPASGTGLGTEAPVIVISNRAGLDLAAAAPTADRRDHVVVAAAWVAAVLCVLALCYLGAVADLALSDMPDEVSVMMGLSAAAPR